MNILCLMNLNRTNRTINRKNCFFIKRTKKKFKILYSINIVFYFVQFMDGKN